MGNAYLTSPSTSLNPSSPWRYRSPFSGMRASIWAGVFYLTPA
jgi:hypothetical protein